MNNNNFEDQTDMYMQELSAIYEKELNEKQLKRFNSIQELYEYILGEITSASAIPDSRNGNIERIKGMYIIGLQGIHQRASLKEDLDHLIDRLDMLENGIVKEINNTLIIKDLVQRKNIIYLLEVNATYYLS